MAMNKAERAALESAQSELAIFRALRWSRYEPLNPDYPKPEFGEYSEGWYTNLYSKSVQQGWSKAVSHGDGPYPQKDVYRVALQGGRNLYSTKLLALQALRYEVEREAAKTLAAIDAAIDAARKEGK